ncbi:hypothetical protein HYC85_010710 [Camellia sinensis]|uniref:Phytocyanin domain-containing protein n=1 Tax=Camellia sinensis TaxID=4442 RepID=A0A7J7HLE2_CAMSI|nr:hypothetical protein HYC85_010710 [Camellia sinensis]
MWKNHMSLTNQMFTYAATLHSVDVVSQSDYNSCNTANALTSYTGGNNNVYLTTTGSMYFICPTPGHCQSGMKLAVTVTAAGTSPPPPPPAAYSTQYTVGDASGWAQQVNYITWVSGKTFRVVFTYVATQHSVDVVSQSDYNSCNTANALTSYTGGNNNVILTTTGSMYFICPTPGHCQSGMKLAVTVAAPLGSGAVGNFAKKTSLIGEEEGKRYNQ